MSSWAIVAVIAIVVWGIVEAAKARAGITTDSEGNETLAARDDAASRLAAEEAQREIAALRERIQVLERIATDNNSLDARQQARIAAEIESLRDTEDKKETGQ
jgi:4-hydroxy-3-methylbut-2-en-1-yl diphosphate synthase IspG/GcpE